MKLVVNIPDYVKEQADAGKAEELGIPLWLAYEIANATPYETVTEFADRCKECGAKYGKLLKQASEWKIVSEEDLEDHNWYLIAVEGYGTPLKAKYHSDGIPAFQAFAVDPRSGNSYWKYYDVDDIKYYMEMPKLPWEEVEE